MLTDSDIPVTVDQLLRYHPENLVTIHEMLMDLFLPETDEFGFSTEIPMCQESKTIDTEDCELFFWAGGRYVTLKCDIQGIHGGMHHDPVTDMEWKSRHKEVLAL